jgi:opacity protein-like surface antigen
MGYSDVRSANRPKKEMTMRRTNRLLPGATAGLWVVCVWIALALAAPAAADVREGNGEIGFDFGFTDFDSEVADDDADRFVIRGGYHFSDLFQLEGHLAVSNADEVFLETTLSTLMVNAVFNFHPKDTIVPYVFVGAGRANLEFDFFSEDDDALAAQVGGGSRFFFGKNKRVAVRVELSHLTEDTFDETSEHTSFVVGFTWRLGP